MKLRLDGNGIFRVTSEYQAIDSAHSTPHTGIDLAMPMNTKLYSPTDGTIVSLPDYGSSNIGKGIIIRTDEGDRLILGHLSDNTKVHVGQHVHTGDFLGLTGSSGRSTGPHLHLGLRDGETGRFINPKRFFDGKGSDIVHKQPHPAPEPHTQIADAAQDFAPRIAEMNPGDVLQHALSSFTEALSQMSLNVVRVVFNSSTFDLILETICTMLCI